ncbi:hypothetical protein EZS27_003593 [termite gut metagenome]|uniref:HIRAN domain-containing protein n=1 Tax=termite gut metagenome TaxID=433724 RepID=A0A5J4SUM4_9ZZZZ
MEVLIFIVIGVIIIAILVKPDSSDSTNAGKATTVVKEDYYEKLQQQEEERIKEEQKKEKQRLLEEKEKAVFNQYKDCQTLDIGVVGIFYRSAAAKDIIPYLTIDDQIKLIKEPTNPHDVYAVKVMHGRSKLGYVPTTESEDITKMIDEKRIKNVIVKTAGIFRAYSWEEGDIYLTITIFYK